MNKISLRSVRNAINVPAWSATAERAPTLDPLRENLTADVVIIGAGYTGLSAAIELASRGTSVVVLEAGPLGVGASGRNGGQINPGLKLDPDDLFKKRADLADDALTFGGSAPDKLFGIVERYGIDCNLKRTGWLMPAHHEKALPILERRAVGWRRRGVDVQTLSREETIAITGSRVFAGAIHDPRGGNLQPLSYVRGLARAALSEGAKIFVNTPATSIIQQSGMWEIGTKEAQVRASKVILATNGYTDGLWPGLKKTIIPVHSFQIATVPLGALGLNILPQGNHGADTRRLIQYFRRDPDGRLLLGGEGKSNGARRAEDFSHLYRSMLDMYPQLQGVEIDYAWSGQVAVTPDYLPHVHELAPGVSTALGYQGRGVAMATALGQSLAQHLLDPTSALGLPVTKLKKIPFHGLNQVYASLASSFFRVMDMS